MNPSASTPIDQRGDRALASPGHRRSLPASCVHLPGCPTSSRHSVENRRVLRRAH
jgi:hypothetical protein